MATRSSPWRGGWLAEAHRLPSPNQGERPAGAQVDLIVVHSISLPPGSYGGGQVQQLFTNRLDWNAHPYFAQIRGLQVSSHFFIERTGALWQFVDAGQRAWHAGLSHYRGRGNCNDDSVGIELEGLEGQRFESAQYAALLRLCRALMEQFPIRFIAGHEHIAPQRKGDPGSGFEWPRLWSALAGSGVLLPPGTARTA
ncbi:1,6-anhydro-N-acetylmuramyl-L-alanine amidase AmpD [Pulveribacter suum]|uniref:1,6-anhydro-N-acetylmuramyl-L-alanine amidase AmpD n=1 Tax=Pulveribacter suum TaxID=2116657 RepID=A0A2P1NPI7_9BURK|nr:1,6-anhydro-N-acetylmuramyl-L-alanine amidase AmpD [Pulveribacter suum]AVP58979.1 1,6-anhydro-N-acetylmuramyl-L-alanine amidase AmpD [Pulveribacter suum]